MCVGAGSARQIIHSHAQVPRAYRKRKTKEGTGVVVPVVVVCTDIDALERDSQEEHRGDGARLVDRSPPRHVVTRFTENESLIWRVVFRHPMLAIISMCILLGETNDGKIPTAAGVHVYPICKLPETVMLEGGVKKRVNPSVLSPVKTNLLDDLAASSSRKFREKWGLGANLYLPVPSGDLRQELVPQRERGLLHLSHVSRCVRLSCPIIVRQKSCQVKQIEYHGKTQNTKYPPNTKQDVQPLRGDVVGGSTVRVLVSFRPCL